jgi:hypothetical protein
MHNPYFTLLAGRILRVRARACSGAPPRLVIRFAWH